MELKELLSIAASPVGPQRCLRTPWQRLWGSNEAYPSCSWEDMNHSSPRDSRRTTQMLSFLWLLPWVWACSLLEQSLAEVMRGHTRAQWHHESLQLSGVERKTLLQPGRRELQHWQGLGRLQAGKVVPTCPKFEDSCPGDVGCTESGEGCGEPPTSCNILPL